MEDDYINGIRENDIRRLEDNIKRFHEHLALELRDYHQEKQGINTRSQLITSFQASKHYTNSLKESSMRYKLSCLFIART